MVRQGSRGGRTLAATVAICAVCAETGGGSIRALDVEMSDVSLQRALRLARFPASAGDRAQFHRQYVFQISAPAVGGVRLQSIEITTEFRRTELIGEEHARINDLFGRSSLTDVRRALAPWHGRVYIAGRVTLSGTAIGLPSIFVALDDLSPVGPTEVQNIYSGDAVIGGIVAVPFDARSVGQGTRIATVAIKGAVLGRTPVDFRAID